MVVDLREVWFQSATADVDDDQAKLPLDGIQLAPESTVGPQLGGIDAVGVLDLVGHHETVRDLIGVGDQSKPPNLDLVLKRLAESALEAVGFGATTHKLIDERLVGGHRPNGTRKPTWSPGFLRLGGLPTLPARD